MTQETPKQVNDLINMARTDGWRRLEIELLADVTLSILIVVHAASFRNARELALLYRAELVSGRFVAGYDGRIGLEIRTNQAAATAAYNGASPRLRGKAAHVQWGGRWRDDYLLAQFDEPGRLWSESGAPLWTGWHEFPSREFDIHA